jgi:hypothetical protein
MYNNDIPQNELLFIISNLEIMNVFLWFGRVRNPAYELYNFIKLSQAIIDQNSLL